MEMLWLVACLCLGAGPALAKVGSFGECRHFFYKGLEPTGLGSAAAAKICQQHRGQPHFATLYDRERLVPHWSAYTPSAELCPGQALRRSQWFVEPQLAGADLSPDMATESECSRCRGAETPSQALNEHYENTAFSRGQLNPGGHQCGTARTATFTLTNAVPLEPCFAHGRWRALQQALRVQLRQSCPAGNGSGGAYVVTGAAGGSDAVPAAEDEEGDRKRLPGRVTVPRHLWTAVCCDSGKPEEKFSLAFLAENKASSRIRVLEVKQLAEKLAATHEAAEIFADDCGSQSDKAREVASALSAALAFSLAAFPAEAEEPGDAEQDEDAELDASATLRFPSLAAWHWRFSRLHRRGALACVLQRADPAAVPEPAAGTWAKECVLREQKHLPGSMTAAEGWPCDRLPCGYHGKSYHSWCYSAEQSGQSRAPCCSTRCAAASGDVALSCDRGDGKRIACSPRYSAVTAQGQSCRAGFPCGLYGQKYFWCYTDEQDAWDYCCAPQHFCGTHGYGYAWCYVDNAQSSWRKCSP